MRVIEKRIVGPKNALMFERRQAGRRATPSPSIRSSPPPAPAPCRPDPGELAARREGGARAGEPAEPRLVHALGREKKPRRRSAPADPHESQFLIHNDELTKLFFYFVFEQF